MLKFVHIHEIRVYEINLRKLGTHSLFHKQLRHNNELLIIRNFLNLPVLYRHFYESMNPVYVTFSF